MKLNQNIYIQIITALAVSSGVVSLAIWTLPQSWTGADLAAHLSLEAIRAAALIANIMINKITPSDRPMKPRVVLGGSILMTALIGLHIGAAYPVEIITELLTIPSFWSKQGLNIAVLFIELVLSFLYSADSNNYDNIKQEKDDIERIFEELTNHYEIDHSNIDTWHEVAKLVLTASISEREEFRKIQEYSETLQKRSESFRVLSEKLQEDSNKFRKALEENVILFQSAKVSIDGYAPIICPDCGTVNPTRNNRTHTVNCSGCGQDASKLIQDNSEATIKKLSNG